jgi:hypothetical protein
MIYRVGQIMANELEREWHFYEALRKTITLITAGTVQADPAISNKIQRCCCLDQ